MKTVWTPRAACKRDHHASPNYSLRTNILKRKMEDNNGNSNNYRSSVSSVTLSQSCLTLCYPMDCSTPDFPVLHQLPELAQIHVHWVSDAIQPSHLLSSPSLPPFNLSQHQGLFKWVRSLPQVAKVLEFQLQHQSFQWTPRTDLPLGVTDLIFLQSRGLSRVFSNITVQKQNTSVISFLYSSTLTTIYDYWKNHSLD